MCLTSILLVLCAIGEDLGEHLGEDLGEDLGEHLGEDPPPYSL